MRSVGDWKTGSLTLDYRTVERDAQGNIVATGGWSPFTFTLYTPAPQASVTKPKPKLGELAFQPITFLFNPKAQE